MRTIVLLVALLTCTLAQSRSGDDAEVLKSGDPSLRKALEPRAQAVYDSASKPDAKRVSLITRDNPLSLPAAIGTEATGVFVDGNVARIVANVWTRRGRYAVEYYEGKEGLFFVYESFAFFEDTAPRDAWRNFMGLPAWERRTYFNDDHSVGYAEVRGSGAPAPGSDGKRLNDQSRRIAALLRQNAGRTSSPSAQHPIRYPKGNLSRRNAVSS